MIVVLALSNRIVTAYPSALDGFLRDSHPKPLALYCAVPNDTTSGMRRILPLWVLAHDAFAGDMEDLQSMADPAYVQELIKAERDEMLAKQIAGSMLSRAALNDVSEERLGAYAMCCTDQIMRGWQRTPERTRDRLALARVKYRGVVE